LATIKFWMDCNPLTKGLANVRISEISLHCLAYNMRWS
jgi:hypothetical protein